MANPNDPILFQAIMVNGIAYRPQSREMMKLAAAG